MTSHELAKKLLELPDMPILVWVDGNTKIVFDFGRWKPVKSFTTGDLGIKLSEYDDE